MKEYDVGKMMLLGIGAVFFVAGLDRMTKKQRRKLCKQAGVKDEELNAFCMTLFVESQKDSIGSQISFDLFLRE